MTHNIKRSFVGLSCSILLVALVGVAEPVLPDGHGYMLILIQQNSREKVGLLTMSEVGNRNKTRLRTDDFVAAGATNYVGDWTMRVNYAGHVRVESAAAFDKTTLERYIEGFPDHAKKI